MTTTQVTINVHQKWVEPHTCERMCRHVHYKISVWTSYVDIVGTGVQLKRIWKEVSMHIHTHTQL